ncbi:ADP-ribosylation factor-like protein 2-binding protein [Phytophthora citrophthora]|uniref:ADP-ribosylation factor-like protein 2-binding protein n=1 Tax=Phytophthora citrophthora TaxID=4793 RepID=A0AAD9G073_9STRA|nr:ADP-ribosylation factor-like protein 2-binding protein [Phytophthora citrophthora]
MEETMNQPEMADFGQEDDEEVYGDDVGDENTDETKLDEMIGVLQDILIDPEFVNMQSDFCRNNCEFTTGFGCLTCPFGLCTEIFDNVSENKLIYMDIFQQYTDLIGTQRRGIAVSPSDVAYLYLQRRLLSDCFSMEELCNQIQEHEDEIPPDVIDVLMSSSDFEEFKILMLSFKQNEAPCIEITGDALICCGE